MNGRTIACYMKTFTEPVQIIEQAHLKNWLQAEAN